MNFKIKKQSLYLGTILTAAVILLGCSGSCNNNKRVYFKNLVNNQKISSDAHIEFGVENMKVVPAGTNIEDKNSGHHHILIDNDLGYITEGNIIPADEKNIHFGKGQTETNLKLTPGKHTLSLQFADSAHRSYGEKLSKTITVFVDEDVI